MKMKKMRAYTDSEVSAGIVRAEDVWVTRPVETVRLSRAERTFIVASLHDHVDLIKRVLSRQSNDYDAESCARMRRDISTGEALIERLL